jgi:V8-like Glu-specific endopeptidase
MTRIISISLFMVMLACRSIGAQVHFALPQSTGDPRPLAFEAQLDDANIEPVSRLSPDSVEKRAARPVGRIRAQVRVPGDTLVVAACTGVLVAPDLLLTASHCVPGRHGIRAVSAVLEIAEPLVGEAPRWEPYRVEIVPAATSTELDYSLLRVQGQPGARFGWASLATRPARTAEDLFVVHHPGSGEQMLTRHDCRVHRSTATDFLHSCDTWAGSSGAPIFTVSDGTIVGIHVAGSRRANYAKQAYALIADSAFLATDSAAMGRNQSTGAPAAGIEDLSLARQGELEVARHLRAVLARIGQGPLNATRGSQSFGAEPGQESSREPLILWDPQQ